MRSSFHSSLGVALFALLGIGFTGCTTPSEEAPASRAGQSQTLSPQVERLASFEAGQDRAPISELEAFIGKSGAASHASIEHDLLSLLARPSLSESAREVVLRFLKKVGSKDSVPALSRLLGDAHWSPFALEALQAISGPEADLAFQKSLSEVQGAPRLALINAVGRRQLEAGIPSLALLLRSNEPEVIRASLNALGFLGYPAAFVALRDQALPASFREDRYAALAAVIGRIAESGAMPADLRPDAAATCRRIIASNSPTPLRSSALSALLDLEGNAALPDLISSLRDPSLPFAMCAVRRLGKMHQPEVAKAVAEAWKNLPVDVQAGVIGILADSRDSAARGFALACLDVSDEMLRVAAVRALGSVGTAEDFVRLFALAENKNDLGAAAVTSLSRISDAAINTMLRAKLNQASPSVAAIILGISAARADREVFPRACVEIESPSTTDPSLRAAAVAAAGALAQPSDMPRLVGILLTLNASAELRVMEKAFTALATVHNSPTEAAYLLLGAMPTATPAQKRPLRHALAVLDTAEARNYFVTTLEAGPGEDWRDAIRAMGNSKLFAHVAPMIAAAKKADNPADKRLAARSVILLISTCGDVDVPLRGEAYLAAWTLTDRNEERIEILKELDWMRPVEATRFREELKL